MVAALFFASCHAGGARDTLDPDRACAIADSIARGGGLAGDLELNGRTTIDVNQYRVRGRFHLTSTPAGDVMMEFTSTSPMGGRREDVVISLYRDTLRVFDRERARLHTGPEVDELVEEGAGMPIALAALVPLVMGRLPGCEHLTEIAVPESRQGVSGRFDGERFDLELDRGRLVRARWPLPLTRGGPGERVEVRYEWRDGDLRELTALLPERRWRVKLDAD
jgi:hypothetical protein